MTHRLKKPQGARKKPADKVAQPAAPKTDAAGDASKPEMTMQEAAARVLSMMRSGMKMDLRD